LQFLRDFGILVETQRVIDIDNTSRKERILKMAASKVDKSKSKEQVLQDFVRYSIRAANGLGNIAEEEGRDLIKRMVEVKRITSEEGDRLVSSLLGKMSTSKEAFEGRIKESVNMAVGKLSNISERELDTLNSRVQEIERRIESLMHRKSFI